MNATTLKAAAAGLAMTLASTAATAQDWEPSGPVKMMIAFQAGGGVDSLGRLLAEELTARKGWEIIPENVPGQGGGAMAVALKGEPADGLSVGITVSESPTYNAQAARNPGYALEDFTYISAITGSQMGIIAKTGRGWTSLADVIAAAKAGEDISFGAMTQRLADGAYVIGRENGVEFTTVMVKGGKGGLNGVIADDIDVAWGAGVQAPAVMAGDVVNLVSAETEALRVSPDAPLLSEFNVPFSFGVKFIVVAPAGLPEDVRNTYIRAIGEILNDPESKVTTLANRAFSGPDVTQGAELDAFMTAAFDEAGALLDASAE